MYGKRELKGNGGECVEKTEKSMHDHHNGCTVSDAEWLFCFGGQRGE